MDHSGVARNSFVRRGGGGKLGDLAGSTPQEDGDRGLSPWKHFNIWVVSSIIFGYIWESKLYLTPKIIDCNKSRFMLC